MVYWHFTFGVVCCLLVGFSDMVIVVGLGCVLWFCSCGLVCVFAAALFWVLVCALFGSLDLVLDSDFVEIWFVCRGGFVGVWAFRSDVGWYNIVFWIWMVWFVGFLLLVVLGVSGMVSWC